MSDFSLTTMFVVPVAQTTLPSSGSTQNLTAGQLGIFLNDYSVATSGNIAAAPYFYIKQGRANTYLQGSKGSDKIKGCPSGSGCHSNVKEWYKVTGCPTPALQITDVSGWSVKCGDEVTLTLRADSSYLRTLYFNGFTRSVTVKAPCCDCGGDPCTDVDVDALIDSFILALNQAAPGTNPDNISLSKFYTFARIGTGVNAILRIFAKPLTKYGVPCDIAAFPFEYDRMFFRTFVYSGPATTADFIVSDTCNIVATATITQNSSYATGTSDEMIQLEKNYYSYQAGYMKHLMRQNGWNQNFESYVTTGTNYTTYYIKFNNMEDNTWNPTVAQDSMVILAVVAGGAFETAVEAVLEAALGTVLDDNVCITTTSTTTVTPSTTTTTTTVAATTTTTTTVG